MSIFKCKMCGGTLEITANQSVAICEYCGTQQTLPKLGDDRRANLYDRANHFRRNNDFDKAAAIYESILNEDSTDAEAYWSLVLCHYGIEYVEDPTTRKRVPTVNRAQFTSVFDDDNYKSALQYADGYQKNIYEAEAAAINEIQKGILAISQREEPFDVFICYKETDNAGRRTPDSVLANDLYHQLTAEGYKVFFSRITLEDKLGTAYEPYIFAALNSTKVMVVLGTKPEYFNAVWVKNEWSRFLALVKKSGGKKVLIPAYRDMDPYDLPEEFSHLQAQDMSKLGFMQDLIHGIRKLAATDEPKVVVKESVAANTVAVDALLKRAFLYIEDGEKKAAEEYIEKALDQDPENAEAYVGKLLLELNLKHKEELAEQPTPFDTNHNYDKAFRFGDSALKKELASYNQGIRDRNTETKYQAALADMGKATTSKQVNAVISLLDELAGYKDAEELRASCLIRSTVLKEQEDIKQKAAAQKAKKIAIIAAIAAVVITAAVLLYINVLAPSMKYNRAIEDVAAGNYEVAITAFEELGEYKDATDKRKDAIYLYAVSLYDAKEYDDALKQANKIHPYEVEEVDEAHPYENTRLLLYHIHYDYSEMYYNKGKLKKCIDEYELARGAYSGYPHPDFYHDARYRYSIQLIKEGKYEEAIEKLKMIPSYEDAAERLKEAKYGYVVDHHSKEPITSSWDIPTWAEYLVELRDADYEDSAELAKELFAWKATIVFNNDEDDNKTDMKSISKYDTVYAHVSLSGGEPNESTKISYKVVKPNGTASRDSWDDEWSAGWSGWSNWWYTTPASGYAGTLTYYIYDGHGNLIGEDSVRITN